ncbi:hypothetical protein F503_08766 [Ophiostoma piceae UAMH 11346]|uniref:Uncharacterized protein n=1 Tax=Ophiostoma piceae (strain UAMH 11346) TaxID=1262450 RepID=S3BT02_OPHP1|nr:hypothetical protein F503_08766 [Ophiostoma piceae UAMH 11346]
MSSPSALLSQTKCYNPRVCLYSYRVLLAILFCSILMPVGPRLARALLPHPKPWHLLGAAAALPAATTELAVPLRIQKGALGWMRSYSHATLPCRRPETTDGDQPPQHDQQSRASASIFEELFPGEARPRRTEASDPQEYGVEGERKQETPGREEVLEEIQQWLQSEVEAGDARKNDNSSSNNATKYHALRTPKGDWGLSAASRRTTPSLNDTPSLSRPADRYTQPTVLVLSGTTPSLMPSDFFRIAPRITDSSSSDDGSPNSRPVDGWSATNGGIYKIVQDRDPVTLAPRGRYYLYFGSPAAALSYAQEMRELHKLARRAVMPSEAGKSNSRRSIRRRNEDRNAVGDAGAFSGSDANADTNETDPFANVTGSITTSSSGLAINNEGSARGVNSSAHGVTKQKNRRVRNSYSNASLLTEGSEEQIEALRNFSLVVPTVRLHLSVQMPADDNGMYKPSKKSKQDVRVTLYDSEALDDVAATDTTTKVLVVLTSVSNSTGTGSYSNYVNADGRGVTTIEGLRSLLAEDGERRNLPWSVSYGLNGVVPVRWLVEEQNRLMRKARAAALQSQEQEAEAEAKEEQEAEAAKTLEQKLTEALEQQDGKSSVEKGLSSSKDQSKKPPILPTALWASRVPNLASKTGQMDENGRFSRFVVSFSHNAEARRFVRSWHRRTVNVRMEYAMSREHMLDAMDAALERGDVDVNTRVPAIVEATVLW